MFLSYIAYSSGHAFCWAGLGPSLIIELGYDLATLLGQE